MFVYNFVIPKDAREKKILFKYYGYKELLFKEKVFMAKKLGEIEKDSITGLLFVNCAFGYKNVYLSDQELI